jgi:hypothetical protein
MADHQTQWQQFLRDYTQAQAEYQAARAAATKHADSVGQMTAAFLAEERARDKLVLVRHRLYCSAEQ